MAQSRLSKILEQEYKTKGFVGGTTSAVGKRALEKLDIRNALFGGSGLGSIIGRKIFGKGYSATRGASSSSGISSASAEMTSLSNSILEEVNINSKITAKNTMALPSMARDMNVMRQNVIKLVKLQGGTPTNKADAWFMKAKEREAAYESQFGASRKPTAAQREVSKSEGVGGLLGFLGSMASKLGSAITGIATSLGPVITTALATLGTVLSTAIAALAAALGVKGLMGGRGGAVVPGGKGGKGGKMPKSGGRFGKLGLALSAALAAALGYDYLTDDEEGPAGGASDTTGATGESAVSSGTDWKSVGKNSAIVGLGGLAAAGTVASVSGRSAVQGYNTAAKRFTDASGKFVSGKSMPKGEMLKKFIDFAVRAQSKGWMSKIFGKLAVRLGTGIALKAMTFLGGLAVPGAGWMASAVALALLAADAYFIYDAIFGSGGILEELEKEDTKTSSPTAVPSPVATSPLPDGATEDYISKVASREGGRAGYDAIFGYGGPGGDPSIRAKYGKNLSEMTIGEALAIGEARMKNNAGAMGKYGFLPSTIRGLLGPTGLSEKDPFNGPNQEKLMAELTRRNAKYLESQGISPTPANLDLAHSVGGGNVAKLYSSDPNAKVADILGLKGAARSTNPQLEQTVAAYLKGKELLHGSTALAQSRSAPPVVVVQNGSTGAPAVAAAPTPPPIQVTTADVLDSEMGKLLLARVYGMA